MVEKLQNVKIYFAFFTLLLFSVVSLYGQTTYISIQDGDYESNSTWSTDGGVTPCNCKPYSSGEYQIRNNETVIIKHEVQLSDDNFYVRSGGELIIQGGLFYVYNGNIEIEGNAYYKGCGEIKLENGNFKVEGDGAFSGIYFNIINGDMEFLDGTLYMVDSAIFVDNGKIEVKDEATMVIDNSYSCLTETGNQNDLGNVNCSIVNNFSPTCSNYTLDFDGVNDHVNFNDRFDLSSIFSIEIWIKRESTSSGTKTILSKKPSSNSSNGYELLLINNKLTFRWNNSSSIATSQSILDDRWYHVAVTFDNSDIKLYVDGINLISDNLGSTPSGNSKDFLIGASSSNSPSNYFHGWLDELRIWDVALTQDQIQKMMNQELEKKGSNVRGKVIPRDISGLNWDDLAGYYPMQYPNHISGNKLKGHSDTSSYEGQLENITTWQKDTSPLPYVSVRDGEWGDNSSTTPWLFGDSVWDEPNGLGIDGTPIDWNIVRTNHAISSGDKDITLLGLLNEEAEIIIAHPTGNQDETNYGHSLRLSWYLRLDGIIDLVGESQLLQDDDSWLDEDSSGYLERDQQGIMNSFAYNYWAAPVSKIGAGSNNTSATIAEILKDGSDSDSPTEINFGGNSAYYYADNGSVSGIKIASAWIWKLVNKGNTYANWEFLGSNFANISPTEGYTMKGVDGSGTINQSIEEQNYVFKGKPNNVPNDATNFELIHTTFPSTAGYISLTGNPFPSALDADQFLKDNETSTDETLYFWEHWSNGTHEWAQYQGGYATYTRISGGVPAVSHLDITSGGTSRNTPGQYVPVGQGFYVISSAAGGDVVFKNSQRVFERETVNGDSGSDSVFIKGGKKSKKGDENDGSNTTTKSEDVMRIRLGFESPNGYHRQVMAVFFKEATDGIDKAFDATSGDYLPNDAFFLQEDKYFVIQAFGEFNEDREIPISVFIDANQSGGIQKFMIDELENVPNGVEIYIKDYYNDGETYNIIDATFEISLASGEHKDRFALVFKSRLDKLDEIATIDDGVTIFVKNTDKQIIIQKTAELDFKQVSLFNYLGQVIRIWDKGMEERNLSLPVDVSAGVYIVNLETEQGIIANKILIE